jgi:aarF domain-containing kinase
LVVQLGQALSTRPDVLPNAYCQELAKLQVSCMPNLCLDGG